MIGIFDSGVGGLTVVKEVFKSLPGFKIIYFGDTARLPYGTKGASFVQKISFRIVQWLLAKKASVIIIACHTSSAWAADLLKKSFPNVPIFEMIKPAVNEAIRKTKNKRIGIIGTPGTIKSGAYEKKLILKDKSLKIFSKACPLLVPLVEEGWVKGKITEQVISQYLLPLKEKKIDTLILACTHYPLLEGTIKRFMGKGVIVINPAKSLVKDVKDFLEDKKKDKDTLHQFFFSDQPYHFEKISHLCFNRKIRPIIKDPFL